MDRRSATCGQVVSTLPTQGGRGAHHVEYEMSTSQLFSLRLPQAMLEELRVLANQRDVPYQSLHKVYLAERIAQERKPARARRRANA